MSGESFMSRVVASDSGAVVSAERLADDTHILAITYPGRNRSVEWFITSGEATAIREVLVAVEKGPEG